jgi:hypothetical protein
MPHLFEDDPVPLGIKIFGRNDLQDRIQRRVFEKDTPEDVLFRILAVGERNGSAFLL